MLFRLNYTIKPLHLADATELEFKTTKDGRPLQITVGAISEEKRQKDSGAKDLFLMATTEVELNKKKVKQFSEIKSPLSNAVREFIKPIITFLHESIVEFVTIFRWRLRNENSTNPIRFGGVLAYSSNGLEWKHMPDQLKLIARFDLPVAQKYTADELSSVSSLIGANQYEPLGHELLQEAWELRRTNPRSAVVIGMAAAETGFKEFSSRMVPAASWLIENVPSPPLIKMLENFLPQLSVKQGIYGKTLAPPPEHLEVLNKGVTIRNQIVHGKKVSIREETVEEVLNGVRDLLYLLDFYNGHRWAWSHINPLYLNSLASMAKSFSGVL